MTGTPILIALVTALSMASAHGYSVRPPATDQNGSTVAATAVSLDHVPIAVRDLERARRHWSQDLGFTLKPGRVHENGIENAHIKFADGTALELITASRPGDALAASYIALLEKGEGGAFLALEPADFAQVETAISKAGHAYDVITGPYYRWLTFSEGTPLDYLFFNRITNVPVDSPEMLRHANGALGLGAVWIAGDRAAGTRQLLAAIGTGESGGTVVLPGGRVADRVRLDAGELYLFRGGQGDHPAVAGITIRVPELAAVRRALGTDTSAFTSGEDARGRFLRVTPEHANGVWLEFLEVASINGIGKSPATDTKEDERG